VIYGDQTAFVKCNEGFKVDGSPFVFCLRTSKWETSKMPSCKIVKCSPLKTPSNGRLLLSKISYSGRAKFTCDDGFSLVGSNTITCMANGVWSDNVPRCKSNYECPALKKPSNGALVYASDSGIIDEERKSYEIGTFVQVKCNHGFAIDGENLISCTDQGAWDFDVEDCQVEEIMTTEKLSSGKIKIPTEFWGQLKDFLFFSCNSQVTVPKFCSRFLPNFDNDLLSFELPETKEYEGMDLKLSELLKNALKSNDNEAMNVDSFTNLLSDDKVVNLMRDSYRFVICLYIDLIILDDEIHDETTGEDLEKTNGNINENIKKMLKKLVLPIYKNQLKI
jgi:Sushi repeat (SCR repeat)